MPSLCIRNSAFFCGPNALALWTPFGKACCTETLKIKKYIRIGTVLTTKVVAVKLDDGDEYVCLVVLRLGNTINY